MDPNARRALILVICGVAFVLVQVGILIFLLTHTLPMAAISLFLVGPLALLLLGLYMRAAAKKDKKSGQTPTHLDSR